MDIDREYIFNTCQRLLKDLKEKPLEQIETEYKDFKEKNPKAYEICCTAKSDTEVLSILKLLLDIRDEKANGTKTAMYADVQVGEFFAKKYLYGKVMEEPTIAQKKAALEKILKNEKEKAKEKAKEKS